ncbi:DUF7935 family protein [Cyclobacterium marinum]|uniref:Uncharacterized protein n=1 Tax=Cyclobacterium marinum (strain ATCC 25205 / DSM 745 / LMG 13164 / NCIMB 1802) TaxID=880070 RepID=G0IYG8_CYCMS|nr:hypothetical protein [Cyclobacterium marinum]AEL26391.1 hypothetical protein Cycma_2652 [Cyclobacterium marinum DSM 745]MBI0399732.1 hypothetical protein [Cyclobacterium marinum]MBR9774083.1 hypothetical protein [Cytophagales bacterium]|tara:strand:+ start:45637 stop:46158 length:522 start_codon:yes stop_codon:yes gene_type:complete
MDYLFDLLKIIVPAGLAIYGMFIITVSFLKKEREIKWLDIKSKNAEQIIPLRIQAAERLCLLMERISPNNLVRRVNGPEMLAGELHGLLIQEIRNEFNHNLSQQVYFTDDTWETIRSAVEQTISLINNAYQQIGGEARSIELSKRIFQLAMEVEQDTLGIALRKIKDEIRIYY